MEAGRSLLVASFKGGPVESSFVSLASAQMCGAVLWHNELEGSLVMEVFPLKAADRSS